MQASVSVFVMTLNEEVNIERCLDSVRWSDDVVVLDSFSEDRTTDFAARYPNVRVHQNAFAGYAEQRNFGLHEIEYRNPWVLVVDADEVVEPSLAAEIQSIAQAENPLNVYLVRRKVFFNGVWVKRNIANDFWIARLMRPKAVRYEGIVHEKLRFEGDYGRLTGGIEHHQFRKGIEDWLQRRSKYARLEAEAGRRMSQAAAESLLSRNTLERRAALKALFYRLPARWAVYYLYNLLIKSAYLDGRAGLRYIYLEAYSQRRAIREARAAKHA